jgi:hypothetical protein
MDMLAYHDDCHLAAAHPHFGRAGIIWIVLDVLCSRETVNAEQAAEILSFRRYETGQYEVALQAAAEIGWAQELSVPGNFSITQRGRDLHIAVEQLTNEYFFAPWSSLIPGELEELREILWQLRDQLSSFRKAS